MGGEFLQVPDGWSVRPLLECTADNVISYGIVQPGSHDENGIPVLRVNNFNNNNLDTSSVLRVSPEVESKYSRTRLKGGEVLLTLVGSTGQSVVVPQELSGWNVPRAIAVIRPSEEVGANWINICLQSAATKSFLDSRANTTVQKTLNLQDVKQIPILLPPAEIKKFIENTATALNARIELNRQTNTTLESMAQALFKSWFVDFDPVIDNALAVGNPIPDELQARAEKRQAFYAAQAANGDKISLPAEIQQLFPSNFVFTEEMGWVPEGWAISPMQSIAKLMTKSVHPNKEPERLWVHFSIPAFDDGQSPTNDLGETIKSGKYCVPSTVVLASKLNPQFPRIWMPDVVDEANSICSTEFMPFVPVDSRERSFLYLLLKSDLVQAEIENRATGSTGSRQRVKPKEIEGLTILVPDRDLRLKFSQLVGALFHRSATNNQQQSTLANLRDSLLPKLLSGQLQIPEAEKQIAEVL